LTKAILYAIINVYDYFFKFLFDIVKIIKLKIRNRIYFIGNSMEFVQVTLLTSKRKRKIIDEHI